MGIPCDRSWSEKGWCFPGHEMLSIGVSDPSWTFENPEGLAGKDPLGSLTATEWRQGEPAGHVSGLRHKPGAARSAASLSAGEGGRGSGAASGRPHALLRAPSPLLRQCVPRTRIHMPSPGKHPWDSVPRSGPFVRVSSTQLS